MKRKITKYLLYTLLYLLGGVSLGASATEPVLTLEELLEATRVHYPALRQKERAETITAALQQAIWYAYLPQISLQGGGSYQSDVTFLDLQMPEISVMPGMPPVQVPPIDFPKIPHLQYNAYLQATQLIWDGGRTKATQGIITADHLSEMAQLQIELHQVEEQVISLYFGVLMLEAQQKLQQALLEEIQRQEARAEATHKSGLVSELDLDEIALKRIEAEGRIEQLRISEETLRKTLQTLTGEAKVLGRTLLTPMPKSLEAESPHTVDGRFAPARQEHALLDAQKLKAEATLKDFIAEGMPTLALYARGGYARPGLNMLDPKAAPFYMVGITLKWDFGRLYGVPAQKVRAKQTEEIIELKREALEEQLQSKVVEQEGKLKEYQALLKQDSELLEVHGRILERAKVQEAEGTLAKVDYMSRLTAYSQAKQVAEVHRLQHALAQYQIAHQIGR